MMSLHNLRIISLYNWSECKFLPPIGKLPYLEKLTLWNMENLEKIGGEFLGLVDEGETSLKSSSSSFFPKLKQLNISHMDALKEWEVGVEGWNKKGSEISIMSCLSFLEISNCDYIQTLPDFLCRHPCRILSLRVVPCFQSAVNMVVEKSGTKFLTSQTSKSFILKIIFKGHKQCRSSGDSPARHTY
ncbi:uncharacterized protein LOC125479205 [Pyrus x bretschneideri]|uniref:uncharacterized protein LOC125479205 n=1 Tax=Pyrus x bretschneideri TaxID=225117 RepID=UPI00202EA304|nr:uncharacterized protein LOC125479205 [Pyrus x bretschneideri]